MMLSSSHERLRTGRLRSGRDPNNHTSFFFPSLFQINICTFYITNTITIKGRGEEGQKGMVEQHKLQGQSCKENKKRTVEEGGEGERGRGEIPWR